MAIVEIQVFDRADAEDAAAEYAALEATLAADGHTVRRSEPTKTKDPGAVVDVVLHVVDHLADGLLDVMIAAALAELRGRIRKGKRAGRTRRVWIYGPDGTILKELELSDGTPDQDQP